MFSWRTVAYQHQVRLEVNIGFRIPGIQRQFQRDTKPSKHLFRPSEQIRPTFWQQVTQVKSVVVSTCLELIDFISLLGVRAELVFRTCGAVNNLHIQNYRTRKRNIAILVFILVFHVDLNTQFQNTVVDQQSDGAK